jgi:DNA replication and repair protein RecF
VLTLTDFRNYERLDLVCSERINLVVGPNGHGKSNLLEAVQALSLGKSPKAASDSELVRWGALGYSVAGRIGATRSPSVMELSYQPGRGKVCHLDGERVKPLSDLVGRLRTVSVAPESVEGECRRAGGRRRALDRFVAQCNSEYLQNLKAYQHAVERLNAVMKSRSDDALISAAEEPVCGLSVELTRKRLRMMDSLNTHLLASYRQIADVEADVEIGSQPSVANVEQDDAVERLAALLRSGRGQASRLGYIRHGAHREPVDLRLNGRPAEQHASQGQLKLAFIAWRLAEAAVFTELGGEKPTLVLDDPFSELDREHAMNLIDAFDGWGQMFLATARDDDLPLTGNRFARIEVLEGHAERVG